MFSNSIVALAAAIVAVEAASKGFNYGSTNTAGAPITQSEFQALMSRAQNLQGTSGFNSARLYTMIQGGTTNTPIEAIPAAVSTKTQLLLGMWASAGQADFTNEIQALQAAISQYGSSFTSLVTGLSVGSEDLYRDSVTGIENKDGVGVGPTVIVDYINQVKSAIKGTALANVPIGHVDTWDAWTNSSNSAVISNVDWLGVDSYPYFETTVPNAIGAQAKTAFFNSYNAVKGVSGGKSVWVTETGWPVSGPNSGSAVASTQNAEEYWQDVGCEILGDINTWWYTLQDAMPTTPSPSFGIVGSNLDSAPLYDLTCKKQPSSQTTSSTTSTSGGKHTSTKTGGNGGSGATTKPTAHTIHTSVLTSVSSSANGTVPTSMPGNGTSVVPTTSPTSPTSSGSPAPSQPGQNGASQASPAIGAGILAIFGLVAAL